MAHTCIKHPHETAEGLCRKCGAAYCPDCLVYPFGPAKPPYCIPCAVGASGVRANASNPLMVEPKENKRRVKEWRKARKRDLDSPPPDGVATWQRMDGADAEEDEIEAAHKAAAEREALRLPPPAPETPTPPPGVNLAPPGPPGEDWRSEVKQDLDDVPLLGFLADDEPPTPLLEPAFEPTDVVDPVTDGQFGMSAEGGVDPRFAPVEEPRPLQVPDLENFAPPSHDPLAPMPAPGEYVPPTPYRPPAYQPTEFDTSPYQPPAYEPSSFEPAANFDPLASYEPAPTAAYEPTSPPEPAPTYESMTSPEPAAAYEPTFEPSPAAYEPVAFEPSADPLSSFGLTPPTPGPDDAPPLPPATSLEDFGLGNLGAPEPSVAFDDPLPPPPVATPPVQHRNLDAVPGAAAAAAAPTPEPPPPPLRSSPGDVPPAAIRPRTPTRIPAAKPAAEEGDAKAMLARIAALRDKD